MSASRRSGAAARGNGVRRALATARTILLITAGQLWDRKLLNSLATVGVMLGVLVLVTVNGMVRGFHNKFLSTILKNSPHVIILDRELGRERQLLAKYTEGETVTHVSHEASPTRDNRIKRPRELVDSIARLPGVVAASSSLPGTALVEFAAKSKSIEIRGIDLREQEKVTPITSLVKEGSLSRLTTSADGLVMGAGVAKELGVKLDESVHVSSSSAIGRPMDMRVVAIFESGTPAIDKSRCYMILRNAQSVLGRPDVIGRVELRLGNPEDAVVMAEKLEQAFGYDAESWQESNADVLSLFKFQKTIMGFIVSAILLVGGFGILAVQVMIVLQKQRDIAILRAVGLRRFDILAVFQLQGFVLTAVGALAGGVLGKIALIELAKLKVQSDGALVKSETLDIYDDPYAYLYGFLFAMIVGLIASLIPAWRGAKVEPVQVLRGQIG